MVDLNYEPLRPGQIAEWELKSLKAYMKVCVDLFFEEIEHGRNLIRACNIAEDLCLLSEEIKKRAKKEKEETLN